MCVAYRRFTPEEYQEIGKRLHEARTALQQREERLADVFNFIERDLELLGATGVEDKYAMELLLSTLKPSEFRIYTCNMKCEKLSHYDRKLYYSLWIEAHS